MEGGGDRTADKILELLPSQTVQTPEGKNGTFSLFSPLFLFVLTTIWSSQKEKGRFTVLFRTRDPDLHFYLISLKRWPTDL
jgi:hypothetical protein